MKINRLRISNFKSFKDIDIELDELNIIIGANASGKSNFIQVFKFINDIMTHGLEDAISLQGGSKYLRNNNLDNDNMINLWIEFKLNKNLNRLMNKRKEVICLNKVVSNSKIKLYKRGDGYSLASDSILMFLDVLTPDQEHMGSFEVNINRNTSKKVLSMNVENNTTNISEEEIKDIILPVKILERFMDKKELMLKFIDFIFFGSSISFSNEFKIYDFDPKALKKSAHISGKQNLESDGSNLSVCLDRILKNKQNKKIFSEQVTDVLPFVEYLGIEKIADKTIYFKMKEIYNKAMFYPASLLSDGTVTVIATIVALFFEEKNFIVFEEPERNMHPRLLGNIVDKFYEVSDKKQILVTTHNPEVIKYADLDNILFINRCKEGFSTIEKLSNKKDITKFIENEIGVEQLYIEGLLGGIK